MPKRKPPSGPKVSRIVLFKDKELTVIEKQIILDWNDVTNESDDCKQSPIIQPDTSPPIQNEAQSTNDAIKEDDQLDLYEDLPSFDYLDFDDHFDFDYNGSNG